MAEDTEISWADDTFNPWEGCQETGSIACVGCYARERNLRYAPKGSTEAPNWGPHAPRRRTSEANWRKPLKWNREHGEVLRQWRAAGCVGPMPTRFVFCASLADVFDNQVPPEWRRDLFDLIRATPNLTWLLLTKRPQNIVKLFEQFQYTGLRGDLADYWPRNAAIGCTVVTQAEADRDIPHLLRAKAVLHPAFAFLSMEPLVEIVDLMNLEVQGGRFDALHGAWRAIDDNVRPDLVAHVDWVIAGGMTDQGKHKAFPTPPKAFLKLRDDCAAAGVPYHHKQNGEFMRWEPSLSADDVTYVSEKGGEQRTSPWFRHEPMVRVGKKAAGRLLNGVEHNDRPRIDQRGTP